MKSLPTEHLKGYLAKANSNDREFLSKLDRAGLRRALWLLRRENARPYEVNPAAAQYSGLATLRGVHNEYRRRGWKLPKATKNEKR